MSAVTDAIIGQIATQEIAAWTVIDSGRERIVVEGPDDEYAFDLPYNLTVDDAGPVAESMLIAILNYEEIANERPVN